MSPKHQDLCYVELKFSTSLAILDLIQPITNRICEQLGYDEDGQYWIWLATQEALNNAIKHGNKMDASKNVHIIVSVEKGEFKIVVKDEGEGFDASKVPDPTNPNNLLKTSGRGLFYMKSFMDRVEYRTEQGTTVTMVKRLQENET